MPPHSGGNLTRSTHRGSQVLNLDHYLDVLARKPGALPASLPLAQARATGVFTPTHDAYWAACRRHHDGDDKKATADLIEVLLLHRTLPFDAVIAGITTTLAIGSASPDMVAVQARHTQHHPNTGTVVALPARIPTDTRPLPDLTRYDALLNPPGDPT